MEKTLAKSVRVYGLIGSLHKRVCVSALHIMSWRLLLCSVYFVSFFQSSLRTAGARHTTQSIAAHAQQRTAMKKKSIFFGHNAYFLECVQNIMEHARLSCVFQWFSLCVFFLSFFFGRYLCVCVSDTRHNTKKERRTCVHTWQPNKTFFDTTRKWIFNWLFVFFSWRTTKIAFANEMSNQYAYG